MGAFSLGNVFTSWVISHSGFMGLTEISALYIVLENKNSGIKEKMRRKGLSTANLFFDLVKAALNPRIH